MRFDPTHDLTTTNGWNVPKWNLPSAWEFMKAEQAMRDAASRLAQIEMDIDLRENHAVRQEDGIDLDATPARRAYSRFKSSEWQQAWQELMTAMDEAKKWEAQWREEMAKGNR